MSDLNENEKIELEVAHRTHSFLDARELQSDVAAAESANVALRSLILMNGGACVALVGFMSQGVQGGEVAEYWQGFASTLLPFLVGLVASVSASGLAYFVNLFISQGYSLEQRMYRYPYRCRTAAASRFYKYAEQFRWIAVVASIGSIVSFCWGCWIVWSAVFSD